MNVTLDVRKRESLGEQDSGRKKSGPMTRYVLAILAGLAALALWVAFSHQGSEHRAVAAIPAEERHVLYLRTMDNLRFCKGSTSEGLKNFCENQAEFAVNFPECDAECRALSLVHLLGPRR